MIVRRTHCVLALCPNLEHFLVFWYIQDRKYGLWTRSLVV